MALPFEIEFWHWWILAILLVIGEVLVPGQVLMWMGAAAGVVGLVLLVVPDMGWEGQLILFAVVAVASFVAWRIYQKRHPTQTDLPTLNRRGEQYVGRHFTLEKPIVNERGELRVDDTVWRIEGEDMPAGTRILVTGVEGVVLRVEQA